MKNSVSDFLALDTVDSTNRYLADMLQKELLPNGFCVFSDFQEAGRGQAGNVWESRKGQNLLFSILLHSEKFPLDKQFLLSEVVSIAICRLLAKSNISVKIKYPNDIFYKDKKIAGILIENRIKGNKMKYSIVGIGLNVNQLEFGANNSRTAISMRQITGIIYDRQSLLSNLRSLIVDLVEDFDVEHKDFYKKLYFANLYRRDGFYKYETTDGEVFEAKIVDIADNGMLQLVTDKGNERSFYFKEVRFVI